MIENTFPTLYKRTSTGKVQTWTIAVGTEKNALPLPPIGVITTTYGLLNGKQQEAVEWIREGKNIGKANETTPYDQAVAEAQSQWEKKSKKSYVQNIEDAEAGVVDTNFITGGIDPMLAHSYEKRASAITYPAYVQPKLDGHRCIAIIQDGKCTLWSRTRKLITGVPHIARELEAHFAHRTDTLILDGELYNHDYKDRFEELTSFIRQVTPKPGHEVVQYWVYDVVDMEAEFSHRALLLADLGLGGMKSVIEVPTATVEDEEEMIRVFGVYIEAGFEGLMIRNSMGRYAGKRSADLQKVKVFQDAEFEVIDVEQGRGKMAGRAMFVCDAGNGKTFRVKMMGALDDLKTMYENREQYLNQMLTVKYQKLSAEGTPIFPVAVRFRQDV